MNLTKLLENRKTENIGSIDLLSEKLGIYSFFDREDFSDVVLFIDRGSDEVYKNYFKTHQNVIQEKMTKARKTFISSFQLEKIEGVNYDVFVPFVSVDEVFDLVQKRQNFNQNFLDFLDYQGEIRTGIILVDKGEMLFIEMLSLEPEAVEGLTESVEEPQEVVETTSITSPLEIQDEGISKTLNEILPFIGKRSFTFCGGNACENIITIDQNGYCEIVAYGFLGDEHIEYQGMYAPTIWIYNDNHERQWGYKFLDSGKVMQLKTNGQPEKDCREEGEICISELYETV